ncbi:MAG: hypothetical protein CMN28_09245 [Salinisphaeraceae bacterium]|nr:hypothetical protein [Salinisphaeraceae bacterium]
MKTWIGLVSGLLLCGSASAQTALVPALLGPTGPVQGLVTTLTTTNAAPLVNSLTGANSGLIQGRTGAGLNTTLTGLLVNQDPGQIAGGLQFIVDPGLIGADGVLASILGGGLGNGLPGLDALPGLPGLDALPALVGGGLPGLPGLPALPLP